MNEKSVRQTIFFNLDRHPELKRGSTDPDFVSNDPGVKLEVCKYCHRNEAQAPDIGSVCAKATQRNGDRQIDVTEAIFKSNATLNEAEGLLEMLNWAYCECILHRLTYSPRTLQPTARASGERPSTMSNTPSRADEALLGDTPPQPKMLQTWQNQNRREQNNVPAEAHITTDNQASQEHVVLFNILVALEWTPNAAYMQTLEWAFRRASDYLYDATDGRMAFGQVIFADNSWTECCDIQVMASDRLHPRSWREGLHEPDKYMPIRMGRGIWYPPDRVVVNWDEPEGYRVLVHEWGHYALGLRDEYLERRWIVPFNETHPRVIGEFLGIDPQIFVRTKMGGSDYRVVVPRTSETSASIMATTVGTSEIAAHTADDQEKHKDVEWGTIVRIFGPWITRSRRVLEGPGRLPLPLPQFEYLLTVTPDPGVHFPALRDAPCDLREQLPEQVRLNHCWLYVVRNLDATDRKPELIAQGTLSARSMDEQFDLLGALPNDRVMLKYTPPGREPILLRSKVTNKHDLSLWTPCTIPSGHVIDIFPHEVDEKHRKASVSVRVSSSSGQPPNRVWLFPLSGVEEAIALDLDAEKCSTHTWESVRVEVPTLDGHILACWDDGGLIIVGFSQGGGPPSTGVKAPIPITAGSSDGNVLIFFQDKHNKGAETMREDSKAKVLTVIDNGVKGKPPAGAHARSYPLSLASNEPLPRQYDPTLVLYYDMPSEEELLTGDLLICRLEDGAWWSQPTYHPAGASFLAMPMTIQTAPHLFDASPIPEYYQVFWIPRYSGDGLKVSVTLG